MALIRDDKPPPGSFLDCLEHETRRVARFVAAEADALWMRLLDAAQSFTAQQGNSGEMPAETCRNRCDSIGESSASRVPSHGVVHVSVGSNSFEQKTPQCPVESKSNEVSGTLRSEDVFLNRVQSCLWR